MSQAIDELEHEHEAILLALNILESLSRKVDAGTDVIVSDVADFLGFLKEFADHCHHGKEEDFLFPAVVRADVKLQESVLLMLAEHAQGRKLIKTMEAALAPSLNGAAFVAAAQSYLSLLRSHIEKEHQFLFPTADRVLNAKQLEALSQAFHDFEEKTVGAGRHETLHQLLKNLKAKYLT